ncbi:BREX system P-loop protein BrxC [Schaalia odontolytica]|uniref:BREX system P-loop protein BrxC n=1 Tax=Schaalia odontolytica TaxID=1660 RepID=UPI0028D54BE0|nr:BREX system P-loop protein BrxC [Schaalia odontolytica]
MDMKGLYAKDIFRSIDGVIKADDISKVASEVDEYVMTSEIRSGLSRIIDAWNQVDAPSNGVWIAGFFGSGKSHLLKMLSYLLGEQAGSQPVTREDVERAFEQKVAGDETIIADLKRSLHTPTRAVLFNIDAKDNKSTRERGSAMIEVFYKVYFEARGLYWSDLDVGAFERYLDDRGEFARFRAAYNEVDGRTWEEARAETYFVEDQISKAMSRLGYQVAQPLQSAHQQLNLSAEAFAQDVASWLDRQGPHQRIAFFVDEVGQFIGDDSQLMLNLQTITEQLATHCHGRAWVFVTSQEELSGITAQMNERRSTDFSKIQGRFAIKVSLSTEEVTDVIARRLLTKNEQGVSELDAMWQRLGAGFPSVFRFPEGTKKYDNYLTRDSFVAKYPFVDYQFEMFTQAMRGLSDNDLFTGRHSSVGARSLLGVCQQIAQELTDDELGTVASFDRFYDGIAAMLKSDVKDNIGRAAQDSHTRDPFTMSVLKVLLLVRYVDSFQAYPRNIAVLLRRSLDQDATDLETRVERALRILSDQVYVQRQADGTYAYMTNEEKEVRREISQIVVEPREVTDLLRTDIRRHAGTSVASFVYPGTNRSMRVSLFVDGRREQAEPLVISVFTPQSSLDEEGIRHESVVRHDTLSLGLDVSSEILEDVRVFCQTEEYVKRQAGASSGLRKRIILTHKEDNEQRRRVIGEAVKDALMRASLFVDGQEVKTGTADEPKDVIELGLTRLAQQVYPRIEDAKPLATVKDGQIASFLRDQEDAMLDVDPGVDIAQRLAGECAQWVEQARVLNGQNVFVKNAIEYYGQAPFGWDKNAVLAIVATALRLELLEALENDRPLARTELEGALRDVNRQGRVLLQKKKHLDRAALADFQRFVGQFVPGESPQDGPSRVRAVEAKAAEWASLLKGDKSDRYNFDDEVAEALDLLTPLTTTQHTEEEMLAPQIRGGFDELMEIVDEFLMPYREFVEGHEQNLRDALAKADSLSFFELAEDGKQAIDELRKLAGDSRLYARTQEIAPLARRIEAVRCALVQAQRDKVLQRIDEAVVGIRGSAEFKAASGVAQLRVDAEMERLRTEVKRVSEPGHAEAIGRRLDQCMNGLYAELIASATPAERPDADEPTEPTPRPTIVRVADLLPKTTGLLSTLDQVNEYIERIREQMLAAVNDGKQLRP